MFFFLVPKCDRYLCFRQKNPLVVLMCIPTPTTTSVYRFTGLTYGTVLSFLVVRKQALTKCFQPFCGGGLSKRIQKNVLPVSAAEEVSVRQVALAISLRNVHCEKKLRLLLARIGKLLKN